MLWVLCSHSACKEVASQSLLDWGLELGQEHAVGTRYEWEGRRDVSPERGTQDELDWG